MYNLRNANPIEMPNIFPYIYLCLYKYFVCVCVRNVTVGTKLTEAVGKGTIK